MAQLAYSLVNELYLMNRNLLSTDLERSFVRISDFVPLEFTNFDPDIEVNGWQIPPKWDLVEGKICKDGKTVLVADNPLTVIGLSAPFVGTVDLDELKAHLHYDSRRDDAIPFHFRQNYRPWDRDWGFSVNRRFFDSLEDGEYEVSIITNESKAPLMVGTCTLEGRFPETICLVSHLDHPGMCNDNLAGVAVGVELFRRLEERSLNLTYQLVIVPEIIGSEYYLSRNSRKGLYHEGLFLDCLGSRTPFTLQASRNGSTVLEKYLKEVLDEQFPDHRFGAFRSICCNDEAIWEAYGIPMGSLSRFPYPEYHCDKDDLSIVFPEQLEEAIDLLETVISRLDSTSMVKKTFKGTQCLSTPDIDLYIDPGQVAYGEGPVDAVKRYRVLMDMVPFLERFTPISEIAAQVGLPLTDVERYLKKFAQKGLITFVN